MGKHLGKTQLARPRRKWEGNIRMDVREVECENWLWLKRVHGRGQAMTEFGILLRVIPPESFAEKLIYAFSFLWNTSKHGHTV